MGTKGRTPNFKEAYQELVDTYKEETKVEPEYKKFCVKYQKLLRKVFRHKWRTGQFWTTNEKWDGLHMYDEEVYRLLRYRYFRETFETIELLIMHFKDYEANGDVIWIPTIWDMQRLLYDHAKFALTYNERCPNSSFEAIRAVLKYIALLNWDEETQDELAKAIKDLDELSGE